LERARDSKTSDPFDSAALAAQVLKMAQRPQFSVIIPTYNRFQLLQAALASVRSQTYCDYELIVVDDGSTDGTWEYLLSDPSIKALRQDNQGPGGHDHRDNAAIVVDDDSRDGTREWPATQKPRLEVILQENEGPGAARNMGAQVARGQYLAFLDSDDLWFPWTLDVYATVLQRIGYPAFLAGKPHQFRAQAELSEVRYDGVRWREFVDYLASGDQWRWWGVSSFVLRRSTFAEAGGFSTSPINGEDADLALRIGTARGFVQVTAPATFAYREHAGNMAFDLSRNIQATQQKIRAERCGQYPGGTWRRRQRWRILTRHVRPVALECARLGLRHEAWALYWSTFRWHVALGRWRFLTALPALALFASMRSGWKT
jgi:GT2 family glycosyltransferase